MVPETVIANLGVGETHYIFLVIFMKLKWVTLALAGGPDTLNPLAIRP